MLALILFIGYLINNSGKIFYFKEIINRSPNDYLVEYRIDKSIDLIMKTDMKMTEIAYECGFNGSSYFAETFKKIVGVSPREYKNKEKKKCTTI